MNNRASIYFGEDLLLCLQDFEAKRGMLPPTKAQAPQLQTQHRARAQVNSRTTVYGASTCAQLPLLSYLQFSCCPAGLIHC